MMSENTVVIVNPWSHHGKGGKHWRALEKECEFLKPYKELISEYAGHVTELTRQALKEGAERIIVVGGDGTLTEAVNGFFENGNPIKRDAKLGTIPMGTGCDFLKSFGIQDLSFALQRLKKFKSIPCDVAKITYVDSNGQEASKLFMNISSFGCSPEIVRKVAQSTHLFGAKITYLTASLSTFITFKNPSVTLTISGRDPIEYRINNVFVCNGKFSGGGMCWGPEASLTDGLLDVTILKEMPKIQGLLNMGKIYSGRAYEFKWAEHLKCEKFRATSESKVGIEVDGDTVGTLPATYEIFPHKINLWC